MILVLVIQVIFWLLVFGVGYELCNKFYKPFSGISFLEKVSFSSVTVIILLASTGIVLSLLPFELKIYLGKFVMAAAILYGLVKISLRKYSGITKVELVATFGTVLLAVFAVALTFLDVPIPPNLPDGAYVIKTDIQAVRIQRLAGDMPIDNAIPHVVAEFLFRGIDFREVRPILPGQDVTNRPIIVSLVVQPIFALFSSFVVPLSNVPTFEYVGSTWPDFSIFLNEEIFWLISLSLGCLLNALVFLGASTFFIRSKNFDVPACLIILCLVLTSGYFMIQTFFTWPKGLAAFFLLLAFSILSKSDERSYSVVGVLYGLAYLSHPSSIIFFVSFLVWSIFKYIKQPSVKNHLISASQVCIGFLVTVPWFIWVYFYLGSNSDLIAQNLRLGTALTADFYWVRIVNFYNLIFPHFLSIWPFHFDRFMRSSFVNLPGALGILTYFVLIAAAVKSETRRLPAIFFLGGLPFLLITLVFSYPAVPGMMGLQGLFMLMLFYAVIWGRNNISKKLFSAIFSVQLGANILLMSAYVWKLL